LNQEPASNSSPRRSGYLVIGFKGNRRELFSNPFEFPFKPGDTAIVEAERGQDAGTIRHVLGCALGCNDPQPPFSVLRKASPQDRQRIERLREYEEQALTVCRRRAVNYKLQMKLVDAEYRFDGLKLTFFFISEGRVDFRDLVKDLAGAFRTRIELRQIGARDEVKRWDGFGPCGQKLCCVRFIGEFHPITTQMARKQNMILNPSKLSGVCGRLKCCLSFEYDLYVSGAEAAPQVQVTEGELTDEGLDKISD